MDKIAVLDFGSQFAHLITSRLRRLGVYAEIKSPTDDIDGYNAIILSGGPSSVYIDDAPKYNPDIFKAQVPVLGICYGMQLMAYHLGGLVKKGEVSEYGKAELCIDDNSSIFKGLNEKETIWMSHGDSVQELPEGFKSIAQTIDCPIAAMTNGTYFGIQFHPEVTHSEKGMKILENFVQISNCKKCWDINYFYERMKHRIKEKVGDKNVFLLVSGGVDSSVCFALLNEILGKDKVLGLHIDNGFMRLDESNKVFEIMNKYGFDNLKMVDASDDFLSSVKEIYDPEEKRNIIGNKFIEVKDKEIEKLNLNPDDWILAQGTIYPDTIESSGTKHSDKIKTHHNRVDIIQELIEQGKIIEPIAELYKDEVRCLGLKLGLPSSLVDRHPFPGPGLAIRCLCNEKDIEIDNELEKELNEFISDYDVKILPLKSVGVQGDSRTYAHPAVLIGKHDWNKLEELSTKITNKFKRINRCLYLVKGNLDEIKLERQYLTKERLDLLRKADNIIMDLVKEYNLKQIWQFPVILIPINNESVVLRPIYSTDVMSCKFADIDFNIVEEMADKLINLGISNVFFDITHKPPGTVEWE